MSKTLSPHVGSRFAHRFSLVPWLAVIAASTAARPAWADPREDALAKATTSIQNAAARVEGDPLRPGYHFLGRAQWMNDPNGPLWHDGFYHMFYQHNPYGDGWGHLHWGHARSQDLVRWEHLPLALWPSTERGEDHCFSGCATINGHGQPMIFYTSIGPNHPAESDHAEQWAALGSPDLNEWTKHPGNPILPPSIHGDTKVYDWRDPFLFRHEGKTYLVLGGNLNERRGGEAVVLLYRARNDELTNWDYMGVLFQHPNKEVVNIECPNFFPLGDKWVLIISPHRLVEYFVGDWDPETGEFSPESRGLLDHSDNFYAPNCLLDGQGRRILWGWIRGFPGGRGWNGCLSLPRLLTLDESHELVQTLPEELNGLRGDAIEVEQQISDQGDSTRQRLDVVDGKQFEMEISLNRNDRKSAGIRLPAQPNAQGGLEIKLESAGLRVGDSTIPLAESQSEVKLRVFVDRSVVEVHDAQGRYSCTKVVAAEPVDDDIEFLDGQGPTKFLVRFWPLSDARPN